MNPFDLERCSPLRLATALFRAHYGLCATAVLLLTGLDTLVEAGVLRRAAGPGEMIVEIAALVAAHRTLLTRNGFAGGGHGEDQPDFRIVWRILWRLLAVAIGIGLLALLVVMPVLPGGMPDAAKAVAAIAIGLLGYGAFLAFFGTFVPDLVLGGTGSFAAALARGRQQARRTFRALLVYSFGVTVLVQVAANLPQFAGIPLSPYDAASRSVHWLGIIPAMLRSASIILAVLMTAAILSRAYAQAEVQARMS
ncbi:hypothetical protein H0I76_07995 [Limibaculum sp. M0105]|uniref:Uncharacterized protein n=1 Tax=Thermohalobaculum xanthum TaxID=2753746 RepID=A0A8J7M6G8_9RHOB|nr:hypothetical protein [Thermohalobaculum xanthum]MBK0399126.1 hypothetical protein [Thermohalobaculum xanthum]